MRKILYSALAASMLMLSSCDKDYLEVSPTDAVAEGEVFTTTDNGWRAVNGMHRSMFFQYSAQDQAGQGSVMINMDMMGEDLVNTTTGNNWFIAVHRWDTHRNENAGTVEFVYRFYYKIIANANMIIANVDGATGTQEQKNYIKGQALAYRAWAHHQLVQIFAQRYDAGSSNEQLGVPLMLTNTIEGQPRATVAQVYEQINKDLDEAIVLLEGFDRTTRANLDMSAKTHINESVAKGMKARVALTQQDWQNAAKYAAEARQAIPKESYALMSNDAYLQGFNNTNNSEWMWGSRQIQDQQTYFYSFFAYMSLNFNSTNIRQNPKAINSALYAKIPKTDIRKELWDSTGTAFSVPATTYSKLPYMNRKFLSAGGANSSIGDVPYMRSAEMYLIEAEAKARMGASDAADVLFTLVSNRNPEYEQSEKTGEDLVEEIMIQRRVELWGEGFRFFDLKRTNSPLNRNGANHNATTARKMEVPAGAKEWQWLFPRREINPNPNIVQNEL
jgi:starch-binding outer membrane protein, SusD/RagB family